MAHEDAVLIRRFRDGDEEAFRILLERHAPAVQAQVGGWIPARVQRRVSIADVLQEARLIAFQRRAATGSSVSSEGRSRRWFADTTGPAAGPPAVRSRAASGLTRLSLREPCLHQVKPRSQGS